MAQSYNIRIEETVTETFPVTADSPEDAVSKARRLYYDGKLVLEPGTLIGLRITSPFSFEFIVTLKPFIVVSPSSSVG